jgi:hypothetical protein
MNRVFQSLCCTILLAFSAIGAPKPAIAKQSWEWSTDERLAARFEPVARAQRVDAAMAQQRAGRTASESVRMQRPVDVITGNTHPELLLPTEVFATMIRVTFRYDDDLARSVRAATLPKAQALGLPPDFWSIVEAQAKDYIAVQQRNLELREHPIGKSEAELTAAIDALDQQECAAGVQALTRLRRIFGVQRFNEFLYTVIAPDVNLTFVSNISAATLKTREEGCR